MDLELQELILLVAEVAVVPEVEDQMLVAMAVPES
jgi:hypothetical protein